MKDELRRFRPNVGKILRDTTPEKVEARLRKALENLPPGEIERPSAPSPWGQGAGAAGLDPASLPSASRPKAEDDAEPHEVPRKNEAQLRVAARRRRTRALFLGFALLTVAAPLAVALVGRGKDASREPAAVTAETGVPSTRAAPSTMSAAAAPGATADATVTANAVPSAAPDAPDAGTPAPPKAPAKRPTRTGDDDPYAAAPGPRPSAEPAPPPPAVPALTGTPQASTLPSSSPVPFLVRKREP